jgi:Protein of unknown function (DUF1616)
MKANRTSNENQGSSRLDDLAIERLAGKGAVPLPALVSDLSKDLGYTTDKVTEGLMGLQSRKLIVISEKAPYASLAGYAASPISLWFWGAVGATLLSVAFLFVTSGPEIYLRYVFGGLLVLFLPGFSLIELLYPKKELDELTRFALSIGLSLALVPLVGLALNYTPFGIRLLPVAFSLSGITLVFLVVALTRKYRYYKVAKDLA